MSERAVVVLSISQPAAPTLAETLIAAGKLTDDGLRRAEAARQASGEAFETVLANLGLVSEADIAQALARMFRLPCVTAAEFPKEPLLAETLSRTFLKSARVLPLTECDDEFVLAMANPNDDYAASAMEFVSGKRIARCVATPRDIEAAIERLYGDGGSIIGQLSEEVQLSSTEEESDDVERLKDLASEAPVIRLVNRLISDAVDARASDIHIEPMEDRLRVRFRIDGVLHDIESPRQELGAAIISRLKIMAHLDIAERRLAQDGRIRLAVRGKDIDFRVSTTPAMHGESVVLRILDRSGLTLDFAGLGFGGGALERLLDLLRLPHGVTLITGPTGSGKTTTLYAALQILNSAEKKILTVEDPVEYMLDGVNQVQVRPRIGLTFASALRSFLRQDPDIMMVGEIRDLETAEIAVQAALTGHIILSTLHTNDAASAVTRLLDMGVEDFLLTSTINGVVAQRLVRNLCEYCRASYEASPELIKRLGLRRVVGSGPVTLYHPKGCPRCNHTGYFKRTSIHETLVMSEALQRLVLDRASASEIHELGVKEGMIPMVLDGMAKAVAGVTSIEEVLRVTKDI